MKKMHLAVAIALGLSSAAAMADVSYNLGATTNYVFRGISQSLNGPALQGGADFTDKSGLYLGTWISTISDKMYTDGKVEWDIYGGYKIPVGDITFDVGGLFYWYPGAKIPDGNKFDTFEVYGAASYKVVTVKYSHALTKFFGVDDTAGSGYLDVSANVDLGDDWTLNLHAGHQKVKNYSELDYNDYKIGVTKVINGFSLAAAYTGNNLPEFEIDGKDVNKKTIALSVSKSF